MLLWPGGQMDKRGDWPFIGSFESICSLWSQCKDQGQLYQYGGYSLSLGYWGQELIVVFWQRWHHQGELAILRCCLLLWCCLWWLQPYCYCHWNQLGACFFGAQIVCWRPLRIHVVLQSAGCSCCNNWLHSAGILHILPQSSGNLHLIRKGLGFP